MADISPEESAKALIADAPKPDATKPPPTMVPDDSLVKRGRGRPRKDGSSPKSATTKTAVQTGAAKKAEAEVSAKMLNTLFFGLCGVIGGDDLLPEKEEAKTLDSVLSTYLESTEYSPPPWIVLIGAYSQYMISKWTKPEARKATYSRFAKLRGFLSNKFKKGQKDESNSD